MDICEIVPVRLIDSRAIERAICEIGRQLAAELGLCSHRLEGDDPPPTAQDTAAAMLQPVSMASVFYDLYVALDIEPPLEVLEAVGKRPYRRVFIAPPF